MSNIQTYEAVEYGTTIIPIENIVDSSGQVKILPEVSAKGYIDIDYRQGALQVVAGRYLGQIPLTKDIIIDVKPRTPISNLLNVVSKSNSRLQSIPWFFRRYLSNPEQDFSNVFEFFARSLSDTLNQVVNQGVWKKYILKNTPPGKLRGKINFKKSITEHLCRGQHYVSSSYYEHSAEHSINQFIAYTINYCLKHFSTYGCNDTSLIHDLKLRYGYFERFLINRRQLDIKLIKQTLDRDLVPNIRHYYNYVLDVSLAIVEETAIELEKSGTDVEASSFVINMANVFEDYIRALLNSSYALSEHGISVIDGNSKESQLQLFNDNKTFLIKPDVVLKSKEHTQLILEVKYKPKFSEADRYQVICHAYSTSCKKAVLVKPKFHDNEKPGLKYVGNVGPDNLELYEYIIDLSDEDYLEMEKRFNEDTFNLLS